MISDTMPQLRVLHLAGSRVSDFYYNLSVIYAREVVQPVGVSSYYAVVYPDGLWQLGTSLDSLSEKMPLQKAIAGLPEVDVVVPHMFCVPGMTSFRGFFQNQRGFAGYPFRIGTQIRFESFQTNYGGTGTRKALDGTSSIREATEVRKAWDFAVLVGVLL